MEISFADSLHINQLQCQYTVNMLLIVSIVFTIAAQMVYISKFKLFSLSDTKNFISFFLIQKLSLFIQQLQGIPLFRVMACSQNNTATCAFHSNSQFGGRSRSQADVYHIKPHPHQGSAYHVLYHLTGDAGIASYYNFITLYSCCFTYQRCIS